jgi:hypothetical protein
MKTTELMIGDYVKYQGHIYIVEEISAKGWVHLIYPDIGIRVNITSDYIINLLEPIPLTAEILKRNGFYYDEDRKAYLMGTIFQVKSEKHDLFSFEICGCPYPLNTVNQLQHALRLCGLSDLANNLKTEE